MGASSGVIAKVYLLGMYLKVLIVSGNECEKAE